MVPASAALASGADCARATEASAEGNFPDSSCDNRCDEALLLLILDLMAPFPVFCYTCVEPNVFSRIQAATMEKKRA